ncbi:MAG: hypothetical protein JJU07_13085 [Natronohydrobacter sp.]|nr:hypothetical protein [Natronohydrobacter sp.]MCC5964964.1 hypothetical protein [Natronohydrobacter sp.]
MRSISHTLPENFADCVFFLRCPQISEQSPANIDHAVEIGKPVLIPLNNGKAETATLNDGFGLSGTLKISRKG